MKSGRGVAFFAAAAAAVAAVHVFFFFNPLLDFYSIDGVRSNIKHFHGYARAMADGLVPYRDFTIEYPPLAAAFLRLLVPFAGENARPGFETVFIGAMIALSAAVCLAAMCALEPGRRPAFLLFYCAAVLSVGPIALVSFDYLPAALTVAALVGAARGAPVIAGAAIGAGFAFKGYPAVLFFPAAMILWRNRGAASVWRLAAGFAGVVALTFAPAFLLGPENFLQSFAYHSKRDIELGSIYSALLLPLKAAGVEFQRVFSHGSWCVTGNRAVAGAAALSVFVTPALVAGTYAVMSTRMSRATGKIGSAEAARWFALPIAAFILGFKVGSPQFAVWLIPFVALAAAEGATAPFLLFVTFGHLQQVIFPHAWEQLVYFRTAPIVILLVEKIVFIAFYVLSIRNSENRNSQVQAV